MHIRRLIPTLAIAGILSAQAPAVVRPPIIGVAHIGLKTKDLAAARNFYGRDLGFQEPFTLDKATGGLLLTYFKVNDHQYIEVFPELKDDSEDRLSHIAFETTNIHQLRDYLASRGVKVPDELKLGLDGNISMMIKDPDGHNVELVQYIPGSLHSRNFGKFLPATRVSERMIHVGVIVADRAAADGFYKDILGFREMWHGGNTDERTDWIDMRVPDGTDWLEYMMNVRNPSPKTRGVMNHLALGVPSVERATKMLADRGVDLQNQKAKIGRDGKWQLNLYDPDLTRAELMEPEPVQPPCCSPFIKDTANPDAFYKLGPDSLPQDGVPKGEIRGPFKLPSKAYPGTFHSYWVYVPAQYDAAVPASLMIFNDGQAYMAPNGDARAQNVMDNLIYRREIPVMIGVFINPGHTPEQPEPTPAEWGDKTTNRPTEYNSLDDRYARVIVDELMPELYKEYNISKDPERHGIGGASSGAIAAFTVAWERPNDFHKVLSIVGSFVNLRGGHAYADIVRKNDKKPIRIYLQDGRNDNRGIRGDGSYDETRDWFFQNVRLMKALTEKGYDVNYTWGMNKHGQKMGGAILPDMMRWLWRDQPVSVDVHDTVERSFREPAKKN